MKVSQCVACESQFRLGVTRCADCGGEVEDFEIPDSVDSTVPVFPSFVIFFVAGAIVAWTERSGITSMSADVPWQVAPVFAGVISVAAFLFFRSLRSG